MNITMRTRLLAIGLTLGLAAPTAWAERFRIDPTHSFIQFSISHLGFSLLQGRFNEISGHYVFDQADPAAASIEVEVKTASLDSNHAERDKHLRGSDFFDVGNHPTASFKSTRFEVKDEKHAELKGNLSLHGVTKPISVDVEFIGAGADPWGGYRRGYIGRASIDRRDFGMNYDLGPSGNQVELFFVIEGIRE